MYANGHVTNGSNNATAKITGTRFADLSLFAVVMTAVMAAPTMISRKLNV